MPAGIALGGNLGDRLKNLQEGRSALMARFPSARVRSGGLYETEPVGCPPGSPAFYNSVIELELPMETDLEALLSILLDIEAQALRVRSGVPNSPRPLDLDLLYAGKRQWNSRSLILPHPRLRLRRFVLRPLADIHPELILPGDARSIADILAELPPEESEPVLVLRDW